MGSTERRTGDTQRLFFALWPDEGVRAAAERALEAEPPERGRRVPRENWHITVAFLGDCSAEQRACYEAAASAVDAPAFELSLDRMGYFPRPQVLWCGASEVPDALARLVEGLNAGLAECGYQPDRRPFRPHMTLVRKARGARPRDLAEPIAWSVNELTLVASELRRDGAHYTVVGRWPLAAAS